MCSSSRVRARWRRNWWPRPAPSEAPSIRPGMSATHEARLADAHHAERGIERGEGIVGDLRARARHRADEARLAGVRQAEQADVGEHAQLERELAALARLAAGELARRAVDARLEVHVAEAALRRRARAARARRLARGRRPASPLVLVADQRAHRHAQLDVVARRGRCSPSPCRGRRCSARWMRAKR